MARCHLHGRRHSGAVRFPVIWQLQSRGVQAMPSQNSGSQSAAGTRGPRRGGREGLPAWSAAWTAAATIGTGRLTWVGDTGIEPVTSSV